MRLRSESRDGWLIEGAVTLVRPSRTHPELRMGSSVRGAIDLALVAERLALLRRVDLSAESIRTASNAAKDVG